MPTLVGTEGCGKEVSRRNTVEKLCFFPLFFIFISFYLGLITALVKKKRMKL